MSAPLVQTKKRAVRRVVFALFTALVVFGFFYWQNGVLTVSRYTYSTAKLGKGLDGYRLVQLSDLHNVTFGKDNARLLAAVEALAPDAIVVTGDAVDSRSPRPQVTVELLRAALRLAPVYYVTGNHELRLSQAVQTGFLREISALGVVVLDGRAVLLERDGASFALMGLGDASLSDATLRDLTPSVEDEYCRVLLAHEPQYLLNYSTAGVDLVLSGHAHGGQFRLPFMDGLYAPGQGFFPRYTAGVYTMKSTTMVVSRGLGNSIIPCRVGNQPDIVLVTLCSQGE